MMGLWMVISILAFMGIVPIEGEATWYGGVVFEGQLMRNEEPF